jgi:D-alanyl-lipoteichoic acid acyltransferase DltB (MBOAT superfamily)
MELLKIVLPLGISFFTFTQIAYLVDAYRGEAKEYDFINYILFVTFFPHL